jgi:hypothetical protein
VKPGEAAILHDAFRRALLKTFLIEYFPFKGSAMPQPFFLNPTPQGENATIKTKE